MYEEDFDEYEDDFETFEPNKHETPKAKKEKSSKPKKDDFGLDFDYAALKLAMKREASEEMGVDF